MFLLHLSFFNVSYAYDARPGKVTLLTGATMFNTDQPSSEIESFYPNPRLGLALTAEAIFAKNSGVEVGLYYLDKPYLRTQGANYLVQKIKRMYITTGYRYWWCKYFSTSIGLFSSFSMGDYVDVDRSVGLPSDFSTSAEDVTKYGLDGSMRFEYDLNKRDGLAFDIRYSYSFTAKDNEKANHILAGIFYVRDIEVK